ncbi:DEAD/DEAH box helicase family protein [Baekduia alba]|uniref:DEAD/DEAH box helicase family protein n=1 Tax=Baekduia alba TaxID=2997333 RepID=UPI002340C396|nr:helicase C-terminal domain-containing protein [Baekduia alba]
MSGLDLSRIRKPASAAVTMDPRGIFTTLPAKVKGYNYPRDVQSEVWEAWHDRRGENDLVVKMNTGGGKTIVGLVMLQSCLAEGVAPATFLTPDIYLSQQVLDEAARLGIATTTEPGDRDFLRGRAILVTNIHKLFNGRSVFGVRGGARDVVDLGAILIDDAHACLATVNEKFTLRLKSDHAAYEALLELFGPILREQSPTTYADLGQGDMSALMAIPFWSWAAKQTEIVDILHPHRDEKDFGFVWPLVADTLPYCRVAVSSGALEIAPPCVPVDVIPSFVRAKRRIYLTATLADDSILVTHFGADAESIHRPITPKKADDLGDRMILTPQDTFPGTSDEAIRDFLVERAKTVNVVVIVPSERRAEFWRDVASAIHRADTLQAGLAELREDLVGLVVLVNKYDGIDLPGDACRILVLDGLPEARGELDRLDGQWLDQSDALLGRQIQRIEQGMGRGIRSNDDHCVVILLGRRLTGRLHKPTARAWFSPATGAQLDLSDDIADQLREGSFEDLDGAIDLCLERDADWVTASRNAIVGLAYPAEVAISPIALAEREAFELAQRQQYVEARNRLRAVFGDTDDLALRGVLKQEAATYLHFADAPRCPGAAGLGGQRQSRAAQARRHRIRAAALAGGAGRGRCVAARRTV